MEQHPGSENPQPLSVTLEIVPLDERDPDPARIFEVSQEVVVALQQDGYRVTPMYTGQRGGIELLFQVVTNVVQTVGTDVWAQRDTISIISGLCTIFGAVSPLVRHLFHVRRKLPTHEHEIKVSITLDDAAMEVTSSDVANDERILQLAERFLTKYPTASVTPGSKVKVRGRVPKRKPPRRR